MASAKRAKEGTTTGAVLGFEEKLWLAADKLRDALLPRLLSDELRVCDAERLAERAL